MTKLLTQWYPGHIKPVRPGVYMQRGIDPSEIGYQYWGGNCWFGWEETPIGAYKCRKGMPADWSHQNDPWRGLAERAA